ncbi:RICIN domain-containing protein [Streptomyces gilvus]|uniref:RICIN domain-containing protein n=1 Tax=Streptomyces gilvus TaxID=2920937 RepID=UPI001F0EC8ED|nr:RICIN domain-containing protein [Streptomyces sp. CME 23]MCH5674563.1 ricin-type beta-trefoil lectin domain protein [Streptomyces sp. CME 23]
MQSPYPPRPPFPPRPGSGPEESDRNLVAQLGQGVDGTRAGALLLARHWQAAYDYAAICLVAADGPASMVAAAAFHRVLGRPAPGALRPQLLGAVRDTVKEWAADERISLLLPELRKPTGGRGLRAARSVTPERRQLAERAFRALPGASQCLLWHTEVEAESITIPAGLLGVDAPTASAALEQAREQFRTGCVRAHRELAPGRECRFYNRLLDVPIRRGGALLPDVQQHLAECRYCRHAAEQLSHFESGLEVLLAETVLGWGAQRYLDSRPGRGGDRSTRPGRPGSGGRHRPATPRRHTKAVVAGVGLTALALLLTVLVTKGWSDDNGVPNVRATWSAVSSRSLGPARSAGDTSSAGSPMPASAGHSVEVGRGRLRNTDRGLCLDAAGGRMEAGVAAVLADCSAAASQQWSYQDDGLLRSDADPALCLDADKRSLVLAGCVVHAGEVRYDLTVRGELLLRGGDGLLVAAGRGTRLEVAERNGSAGQRWELETAGGDVRAPEDPGKRPSEEQPAPGTSPSAPPPGRDPRPAPRDEQYRPKFAPAHSEPRPAEPPAPPLHQVRALTADTLNTVTTTLGSVLNRTGPADLSPTGPLGLD